MRLLALALMSLALLTITVMSIMSLSIVLMLQLLSQLRQLQDFHHQLRNLECHCLNIIQPAKHLQQMHDNWSDSWRIIWIMDYINASSFNCLENSMSDICQKSDFATLLPLFERVLCAPASLAPVERIFSQSGLTFRPHREKMSDQLLEAHMFLKCNSKLCDWFHSSYWPCSRLSLCAYDLFRPK